MSQHVGAILSVFARDRGLSYEFLSLNDAHGPHRVRVGGEEFAVSGFSRAKVRFAFRALRASGQRPVLAVATHPHLAPLAWVLKRRRPGLRVVVLTHGIEVWKPMSWLKRWALQRADRVVAPSQDTAQHLVVHQGVSGEKIRVIPWGLDPRLAAPGPDRLPAGFPRGRVVLTVGRWSAEERYKGVDHLIACLPRLRTLLPDLYLVAVGGGDDRRRLQQVAAEAGVGDRVRFLSGISRDELMACYARCDVFALPSRGEGFGLVFLEAMAQGKPVVGGAHGGTPEIIEEGVTGLLVSYGDVERLAHSLQHLLTQETARREMGARARERVQHYYLYEHFAKRFGNLLAEAMVS